MPPRARVFRTEHSPCVGIEPTVSAAVSPEFCNQEGVTGATGVWLPPEGRAALRAGVIGNWIDNVHVFLPLTALAPAIVVLGGPGAAQAGALVVVAMLLGRPLGGVIFGRIADRLGRTATTRIAIAGTAACAAGIALMPTHLAIGAAALAGVLVLRFVGGVFVAGEYSAAIPLAMEWTPPRRRGLMSGVILAMAPLAQATIAFATAASLALLGREAYVAWGWRALFGVGVMLSLGMFAYYSRHVVDAPVFHRQRAAGEAAPAGIREVLFGSHAGAFWQVFTLMSGLWVLTAVTVLILPGRLSADAGFTATQAPFIMGVASLAQAVFMAGSGHASSLVGRRRLFVAWMAVAAIAGPALWFAIMSAASVAGAAALAACLQVVTVSAYGPVSAYLSERFPTQVRSSGYGMGYSLSLIAPALFPFYLPALERALGRDGAPVALLLCGAGLVTLGAALGPRLSPTDVDHDIDVVAGGLSDVVPAGNRTGEDTCVREAAT
ncbi:MFS transporter [Trueperella pecoris]|nr:MFS transporter [Trueperella pecoris]